MSINPRKLAVQIIYDVLKNKSNLSIELSKCRKNYDISNLDMRLVVELSTGVLRNLEYIDYAISKASDIKISKIAPYVMCVLRTGTYQILFLSKIPPSASVNESVKIIKNSSNRRLTGFVNAVLRKVILNGNSFDLPTDEVEKNSVLYSCPKWIVDIWKKSLGDEYVGLLKAMNAKPDTILRANTLKTDASELSGILNSEGWECTPYASFVFPDADYLVSASKVSDLQDNDAYRNGLFYVQDSAGAYVAEVLNPKPGSVVFDMCASPGGKTTHLAEKMKNKGKIYAFDVSDAKVSKIRENAKRLGIDIIEASVSDSSLPHKEYFGMADYLLVDAPCSGFGIIRKKPDIKYLRNPGDSEQLSKISLSILNASAPYLKSGGTMVFSTCTTVYEENEGVLFKFLERNKDFKLKKINTSRDNDGYITLYPHKDDCDGFFISLLTKD